MLMLSPRFSLKSGADADVSMAQGNDVYDARRATNTPNSWQRNNVHASGVLSF